MKHTLLYKSALQILSVFLFCTPIQAFAEIRIAACFTGDAAESLSNNELIAAFTKNSNCFEIEEINYGAQNQVDLGGTSLVRPSFDDLEIIKNVDTNSPGLFLNMVLGKMYDSAIFIFFEVGDERVVEIMRLELKQVHTVRTASSTVRDDSLSVKENVSFRFEEIKTSVNRFDPSGQSLGPVEACWNLSENTNC